MARLHAATDTAGRPWSTDEFAAMLSASSTCAAFNAYAFALGRVIVDEAELLLIVSDPAARRLGYGSRVLKDLEIRFAKRGAVRGFLEVARSNTAALALYQTAGWHECGERKGYYTLADGLSDDAILMEKPFLSVA